MYTKDYKFTYVDKSGKIGSRKVTANNTAFALLVAQAFCNRYGFRLNTIVGGQ